MENFEILYQESLANVEESIIESLNELNIPESTNISTIIKSEASLDGWDYCYAIAIGLAGVFISTNEAFGHYLDQIHKAASGNSGDYDKFQSFLGDMLHHEGDHIDAIEMPFKNRNGDNAYCIFHRLLWGHDILSNKEDNPFLLMFNQKGLNGIFQAVRHLLADTASKQGLPLPGSSFFDLIDDNNKTSNYLIKIAQQLSEETIGIKTGAQEIYSHMMTIRAQDVTAGVVVNLVTDLYFLLRKIENNIRRTEVKLIAYMVNFLGEAVIGSLKQNGVPYINIPLAGALTTTFIQFCYYNSSEIKSITSTTENLHSATMKFEESNNDFLSLPTIESADEYITLSDTADANIEELLDFLKDEK
ncbi:MAG: hypothetical protein IJZ88_06570 [Clostridia bacterium]|nr:hypothetical protein [Clostridia bacterium]